MCNYYILNIGKDIWSKRKEMFNFSGDKNKPVIKIIVNKEPSPTVTVTGNIKAFATKFRRYT